jgi:predicted NBD/HSP70 family sugar kinase
MTEPGLVVGVDIGTTGVKVAAVDAAASLVRVTQVLHPDPDDARFYRALLPRVRQDGRGGRGPVPLEPGRMAGPITVLVRDESVELRPGGQHEFSLNPGA